MRLIDVDALSPEEKLDLIDELWDSLDPCDTSLTSEQMEELDRRIEEADRGPLIAWDDVKARARQRWR